MKTFKIIQTTNSKVVFSCKIVGTKCKGTRSANKVFQTISDKMPKKTVITLQELIELEDSTFFKHYKTIKTCSNI